MERRVANAFPGPPPPVPYYHNNYNPHHHQIHPPPPQHHHVAAVGFHQYPQNDNRDQPFRQPHFDNYSGQQQNNIVDQNNNAPPPFPSSPCGGSLRKRRSQSATDTADGSIAKLYVAPVSKIATEHDIRQVFEKYGNVTEIILPKDKMTGERAAYCFVKYKKLEEGNAAIAALTEQFTFPGEMLPVKVRYADAERERIGFATVQPPDNPKLYVRCLNKQTTKMEVHEVFSRFGVIEDIYMALDDMKISRGYAFVQFSCREMALAAIKGLNGVFTIRGSDQPLIVRFADPKKPRLGEQRSTFNTPPAMQQFDPNWHPQPYPQWENKEHAAPRVVQHHDFASQPNHFSHQNTQVVSEVHKPPHQDIPPQNFEKHQKCETASVETRSDGQKISSHSNAFPEEQNTVSSECDWSEHTCPDGNKYYFHCITCESTWEKPDEYSMFERWFEEQTSQHQKLVSPLLNKESQEEANGNSEQVQSHLLQQNTKLQQPSLSTVDQENVYPVTAVAVETCS